MRSGARRRSARTAARMVGPVASSTSTTVRSRTSPGDVPDGRRARAGPARPPRGGGRRRSRPRSGGPEPRPHCGGADADVEGDPGVAAVNSRRAVSSSDSAGPRRTSMRETHSARCERHPRDPSRGRSPGSQHQRLGSILEHAPHALSSRLWYTPFPLRRAPAQVAAHGAATAVPSSRGRSSGVEWSFSLGRTVYTDSLVNYQLLPVNSQAEARNFHASAGYLRESTPDLRTQLASGGLKGMYGNPPGLGTPC
jgi:hypothetical protein